MRDKYLIVGSVLELINNNKEDLEFPLSVVMHSRNKKILDDELLDFYGDDDIAVIFDHITVNTDDTLPTDMVFIDDVSLN